MPTSDRTAEEYPSDALLLAAIDRANRHRATPEEPGVVLATIKEHLGLNRGSWTTRRLQPQFEALQTAGLIEMVRRRSRDLWRITSTGQQRLGSARRAGETDALPEAPQHRKWREGRSAATERTPEFREELRGVLAEATGLLDAPEQQISSATWFELGLRMQRATARLASATYCLNEWTEPDESNADIDEPPYGQGNRRHPRSWNR
jgi:hypothetical protein